jgi:hypothetical protein
MVAHNLDAAGTVNCAFIVNSLSVQATGQAPDHATNRNTSGVDSQGKPLAPEGGVKSTDGAMFAGCYPNWQQLLDANKQSAHDERARLNIKNTRGKKPPHKGRGASAIKSNKKQVGKLNRKIASLKARLKSANDKDDYDKPEAIQDNAGDQFGGRKKKKENKS